MEDMHKHTTHPDLVKRLKRAEGHLRHVIGMIEGGETCLDIARQLAAVESAVTAAIVLWNTVYLERAIQGLVEAGKPVDGELLQFLSPLGWEHINLTGDYVWRQSRRLEDGKFRPLRMPGKP